MENNIRDRLNSFFQKEQDQKEINSFWEFFLHSKDNKVKEDALFDIWNEVMNSHSEVSGGSQKAYAKFQNRISKKKSSPRIQYHIPLFKYIAIFLSPILLFMMVWEYAVKDSTEMLSSSTSNATTKTMTLPDGTIVRLNAGTTLEYPSEFSGNTREVTLLGEANFVVAHNKKKPFIVKTTQLSVTALGTKFNVRAYDTNKITTTLEQGSIRIATEKKEILVKPNEQVIYTSSDQAFETKKVDINDALGWMNGNIFFEDATLPEILAEIERYHNIRIIVKGTLDEKTLYSIKYKKNETLKQMLDVLCHMIGNISYQMKDEKRIEITTKI